MAARHRTEAILTLLTGLHKLHAELVDYLNIPKTCAAMGTPTFTPQPLPRSTIARTESPLASGQVYSVEQGRLVTAHLVARKSRRGHSYAASQTRPEAED